MYWVPESERAGLIWVSWAIFAVGIALLVWLRTRPSWDQKRDREVWWRLVALYAGLGLLCAFFTWLRVR